MTRPLPILLALLKREAYAEGKKLVRRFVQTYQQVKKERGK
jgi:hypothetical protein